MVKNIAKQKLKEYLAKAGRLVDGMESLPKRGGYHYEKLPFSIETCLNMAIQTYLAKERLEHWYVNTKSIYVLVPDEMPQGYPDRLLRSISGKYDLESLSKSLISDLSIPCKTKHAAESLEVKDEHNRILIRYRRHKTEIDELKKIYSVYLNETKK